MSEVAIEVQGIGKRYNIFHQHQGAYLTLREQLVQSLKALGQNLLSANATPFSNHEAFWALKDVSLAIKQGEVVGIIGRNGAGKSTLLKILSRITEPTTGRLEITGRVASLLEVGTGFHGELTGRENIFLNGAILGMGKAEIKRKFDEIAAFAEVEQFLDTPVKRYSSGMYVRLAFAVAAHLEPDVLIVDEVLAVGDMAFQKKCLGKMGDVAAKEGRTVLFVSHNMSTVQSLCDRVYLLDQGQVVSEGITARVIDDYLAALQTAPSTQETILQDRLDREGDGSARILSVQVKDADGHPYIRADSRLQVIIRYQSDRPLHHLQFSATLYDQTRNVGMLSLYSGHTGGLPDILPAQGSVTCITEPLYLTPGRCYLNLAILRAGMKIDHIPNATYFDVEMADLYGTGKLPKRDWVMCVRRQNWSLDGGPDGGG